MQKSGRRASASATMPSARATSPRAATVPTSTRMCGPISRNKRSVPAEDEQGQGGQKSRKQDRGQAFPEQQRITLDERLCRRVQEVLVGMAKVENELGQFVVALIRIGVQGFLQRPVDPGGDVAGLVQQ